MEYKQIRVLQILPTLGYGGVAQFLLNYYSYMDRDQIVFDFVTHGKEEVFHKDLKEKGSNIYYLQSIGKVGLIKYLRQLKYVLTENQYDIVHTHDGHLTGLTAMLCKIYYHGPVICHAHTTRCVNASHKRFMPLFRWLSRHYGDYLLGCGVNACKYCFGEKSHFRVIHNAISLDKFMSVSSYDIEQLRRKLEVGNRFVIGHVGLFCPPKNHEYILKIFNYLLKKHPNTLLVLIGGGELKESIEEKARMMGIINNIKFEGVQTNIPVYLHIFDTFILPSLHEGLPVSGIEAQAVVKNVCFSDTIDRDVDTGVGSACFIPITEDALIEWEKAIFAPKNFVDKDTIRKCFIESGYDIVHSVNTLYGIYSKIARK